MRKMVSFEIDEEILARVDNVCMSTRKTRSDLMRQAVQDICGLYSQPSGRELRALLMRMLDKL